MRNFTGLKRSLTLGVASLAMATGGLVVTATSSTAAPVAPGDWASVYSGWNVRSYPAGEIQGTTNQTHLAQVFCYEYKGSYTWVRGNYRTNNGFIWNGYIASDAIDYLPEIPLCY